MHMAFFFVVILSALSGFWGFNFQYCQCCFTNTGVFLYPDSKVHGAHMGPTCILSAPDGPHVGPMNLAIRVGSSSSEVVVEDMVHLTGITDQPRTKIYIYI